VLRNPEIGPVTSGGQQRFGQEGDGRGTAAQMHPCVQQARRGPHRRQGPGGHQGADEEGHPGGSQAEPEAQTAQVRQQQPGPHRRQWQSVGHPDTRAHSHHPAHHSQGEDPGQGSRLH